METIKICYKVGVFTGIIDHIASILSLEEQANARRLKVQSSFTSLQLGESIAVNGVCLTVTESYGGEFLVDLSKETLQLTNLKALNVGDLVNVERALLVGDRLGGHIVTGHVDGTGQVEFQEKCGDYLSLRFSGVAPEFRKYLIKKGSIAVNGVSLTLNEVNRTNGTFDVMLIPHTLEKTNLKDLKSGSVVNLEFDSMNKVLLARLEELLPSLGIAR